MYSWGNGDDGRLGHGNIEMYLEPTLLSSFIDIPIRAITCGGSHSGAIAANGDVYLWGNGQHGQLGTGVVRSRRVPTKIRLLQGKHVTQLSFGEWYSMALREDGHLYAWGFGEEGQLGIPDEDKKHSRIMPHSTIVHALSGTGATMVRCGGSHTFVVSVLEARRPHLARMHRRASQSEILKENERISGLSRLGATRLHQTGLHDGEHRLPHSRSNPSKKSAEATPASGEFKKTPSAGMAAIAKKKSQSDKLESSFRDLGEPIPLRVPVDFSWKDRPMTTRAAVRSTFRQEMKALSEIRESHTPIPMPVRTKTANAFISPRLKRLHEQVLRSTEAGAGLLRCQSIVSTEEISASISGAAQIATKAFFNIETVGLSMTLSSDIPRNHPGNQSGEPESRAEMLREVRGKAAEPSALSDSGANDGDGESDRSCDDDEIAFRGGDGGRLVCTNLEREVAWQLSSP